MDDQHTTQQPARLQNMILGSLRRAERALFTRPAPKSPRAQVKFLCTRAKGSTQAVAKQLGVSRSTVERATSRAPPEGLRAARRRL